MTNGAQCIKEDQTLAEAARMMRDLDVGSLPICGNDEKLHGMLTDRDIVVRCIAEGGDCTQSRAGDFAQGTSPLGLSRHRHRRRALRSCPSTR